MADGDVRSAEPWPPGRVLVVVATFREEATIAALLAGILAAAPGLHALVVDDDSPDDTSRLAFEAAAAEPRVHVLVRRGRRGLGTALAEGLALAKFRGFTVAVTMDADASHDPQDIPRLLAALEPIGGRPLDVVIGSRRVPGGRTVGWPVSRHVLSRLVCWFTRWVLGVPVRDASSGFRAVRLAILDRIDAPQARGYAFLEDFLWRVHRAGGRIMEVPITFHDRTRGASKADFAEKRRSLGELLLLARLTWLGR